MWVARYRGRGWYDRSQIHPIMCPCPDYLLEILPSLSIHLVCRNSSQSFIYFWIFLQWNLIFWGAKLLLQCWMQSPPSLKRQQTAVLLHSQEDLTVGKTDLNDNIKLCWEQEQKLLQPSNNLSSKLKADAQPEELLSSERKTNIPYLASTSTASTFTGSFLHPYVFSQGTVFLIRKC